MYVPRRRARMTAVPLPVPEGSMTRMRGAQRWLLAGLLLAPVASARAEPPEPPPPQPRALDLTDRDDGAPASGNTTIAAPDVGGEDSSRPAAALPPATDVPLPRILESPSIAVPQAVIDAGVHGRVALELTIAP